MSSWKKQMKKIQRQQQRLNEMIRLEQASCPHVSKKGKTWLEIYQDGDVVKGRCRKCRDVVIMDREYLTEDMLSSSVDIIKSALAEIRAAARVGKVRLDDDTVQMMSKFDAEILRDLPSTLGQITQAGGKKKKKKKKKANKRKRWY